MTTTEIILILAIHWFADFVLQTDKQAKGKSKNWSDLLAHTLTYSAVWVIPICLMIGVKNPAESTSFYVFMTFAFVGTTFVIHTIQDYITSRINAKLWADGKVHLFFVSIGFDQLLHYIQLILTYQLLK